MRGRLGKGVGVRKAEAAGDRDSAGECDTETVVVGEVVEHVEGEGD